MAGEMLKAVARIDIVNVPYRGTAPAMNDVIAGQADLMFVSVLTGSPQIKAGAVKLLGVTSAKRQAAFPDAPAIGEVLPGYESNAWFGLLGPAKLPPEIVKLLSDAAMKGAKAPEFADRIALDGGQAIGGTPEEFARFLKAEIDRTAAVVKETGAKID
jgi:tripartite-type tricarboxylate transporter receptor subunit TctC